MRTGHYLRLAVVFFLTWALGCASLARPTSYASEIETCLVFKTCEGYRACRKEVADRYGRPYSGWCGPGEGP